MQVVTLKVVHYAEYCYFSGINPSLYSKMKKKFWEPTQESAFSPFHQTPQSSYLSLRKGGDQISKRFNFEIERRMYEVQKSSNIELVKSKAVPLRHPGVKGEWSYSSYLFLTSALDGVSGQRHAPAAN
jgi:hypothetical protein